MSKYQFLDLETQNHQYCGSVASPRHPENYVVLNGWAVEDTPYAGEVQHLEFNSKEEAKGSWLHIPDDVTMLVCHNAPFELDWMLHQERAKILAFLKRGGRVFCTAYAHYLLSNQLDTYPALNDIAPLYGGTAKVDGVKILWEQGALTSEIDRALLLEYLTGPEGDVANTRITFYGEAKALQERGMWEMALERMEGMLFCVLSMDAGLCIDKDTAMAQLASQEAKLSDLAAAFAEHRTYFPELVEFKDTSDFHMSAWLFGGPIKYRHRVARTDADGNIMYEKEDCYKFGDAENYAMFPVSEVSESKFGELTLEYGACDRYKAGKNKGQPKLHKRDTAIPQTKWDDTHYICPPLVDLTLLPQNIYKEFMREFTGKRSLGDNTPVISTGKDCLDMLSLRPEFPEQVRNILNMLKDFARIDKDVGTYYLREERDDEGNVTKQSGMLQYLDDLSFVHHSLNMTSTVTTRLSSNRPNFQNLPRGDTSDVKRMFTSRYDSPDWLNWALGDGRITQEFAGKCFSNIEAGIPNGFIVEADYSALEVVTLAAFSQDTNLVKALLDGTDMHCMRLSQQLQEPYADVLLKCKDQTHPDHAAYDHMRTAVKPKAFAYQYGATAQGIAFATGCTVEEAQAFIDAEKALFPEVETFYAAEIMAAIEHNTTMHREQGDDGTWHIFKRGIWQSPGGTTYSFREFPKTRFEGGQRISSMEFKPTQARNYPIQGESGFFVQGVSGLVARWFIANDFFGGLATPINQVHDALYFDVHRDALDQICGGVKYLMELLPQYFSQKYGYKLNVPFPAAVEFGVSMHQKLHWHPGVLQETTHE